MAAFCVQLGQMRGCKTVFSLILQVEALVAHDSHQIKQIEVLKAELARMRGSNRTESLAALHNEALQEVSRPPLPMQLTSHLWGGT